MIGIYKIISPSGKIYIGQSVNIINREKYYKNPKNCINQTKLYRSILKYGWENHMFSVIEECCINFLNEKERYWQDFYNSINSGLNCKLTKTNDKSGQLSQETKEKIGLSNTGKKRTTQEVKDIYPNIHPCTLSEIRNKKIYKHISNLYDIVKPSRKKRK